MSRYEEIHDDLLRRLRAGEWKVGDAFATIQQVQDRYDVSIGTVRAAVTPLREAGYVRVEQGKMPVVVRVPPLVDANANAVQLLNAARDQMNSAIDTAIAAIAGREPAGSG